MPNVRLKRRAKVWQEAGDIVHVSPADATFLIAVGTAELVLKEDSTGEAKEQAQNTVSTTKSKAKK